MAFSSLSAVSQMPDIPEIPFHADESFDFSKKQFGKANAKMRGCTTSYFTTWPWLTYHVEKDVVFCHLCIRALKSKKMNVKRADPSFVQKGFSYWKMQRLLSKT